MSLNTAVGSATVGIRQSLQQLDHAARRIATPSSVNQITQSTVETIEAKHGVKANTRVLQVTDEMLGTMIDVIA